MTENAINLKNTVEAIIFASGEPIARSRLVEALGCSPERLDNILNNAPSKENPIPESAETDCKSPRDCAV